MSITKAIKIFSHNKIYLRMMEVSTASMRGQGTERTITDIKRDILTLTKVSPHILTKWIENTKQPELGQVAVIAQVLDCSIDDLVHYEGDTERADH